MQEIYIYIVAVNALLFVLMGVDKFAAKQGMRRIPEATLFALAAVGGSLGGIAGMRLFRHKTRHRSFTIGFPLILLAQIALGLFIFG
ncbi:MAG: DUF1294 domain-containing protein [Oscillospiraceae bacterium]|nr:DUF1294 domain-containing protein [Oscillospiraceae bacterium]